MIMTDLLSVYVTIACVYVEVYTLKGYTVQEISDLVTLH